MAMQSGTVQCTIEFAVGLKDKDWFGKQDPYCILRCGHQQYRTRTATDGGKQPVWNQTFHFNVINENDIQVEVKDEDVGKDDLLGRGVISLANVRSRCQDRQAVPLVRKSGKSGGTLNVALTFTPSGAPGHGAPPPAYAYGAPSAPPAHYPPPAAHPPPAAYPPPAAHPPAPAGYPPPAQAYGHPPPAAYPPPAQAYGHPPPAGYPPPAYPPAAYPPPAYHHPPPVAHHYPPPAYHAHPPVMVVHGGHHGGWGKRKGWKVKHGGWGKRKGWKRKGFGKFKW